MQPDSTNPLDKAPDLIPFDPLNLAPGEFIPPEEEEAIEIIAKKIEANVSAAAQSAPAHRDAHAKAHGCVKAEFQVLGDLPDQLRAGIFAKAQTFDAWIRFSNGNAKAQKDRLGDGRGMAIKVLQVDSRSTTQDFLLINHPVFFVRNAADYVQFQYASPIERFFFPSFNPFSFRLHEFFLARAIAKKQVLNMLNICYWSMTPYLFGQTACKFSVRPTGTPSPFTQSDSSNFLHDNLVAHLASDAATFDFSVQLRTRTESMPVEDPTIEWRENESPFIPVARITIPPQQFDSPTQCRFCENLSYSPWHGLEAHRPLGGINRVRRVVYERTSILRHQINNQPRVEPTNLVP